MERLKKRSLRWLRDLWPDAMPNPPLPREVLRRKNKRRQMQKESRWKNRHR